MACDSFRSQSTPNSSWSGDIASASIALGLLLIPGQAKAQNFEATTAAAGDKSNDGASAWMSARVGFDLRLERPDTFDLPLGPRPEGQEGLLFRGVRRDAMNSISISLEGEMLRRSGSNGGTTDLFFAERAGLAVFGWQLEQRLSVQHEGRFDDAYWRSGRGLTRFGGTLRIPPMMGLRRKGRWTVWGLRMAIGYDKLLERSGGSFQTLEFDLAIDVESFGAMTRYIDIGVGNMRLQEYGVPITRTANVVQKLSVTVGEIEVVTVDARLRHLMTVSAKLGVSIRGPLSRLETITNDDGVTSQTVRILNTTPLAWLEFGTPAQSPLALKVGGGAFSRISPDGFAADSGARGEVSAATTLPSNVSLELLFDAATVTRKYVGELASDYVEPVGTKFFLTRASAAATMPLTDSISLTASGYGERTDREDPRRHSSRPDASDWGYGVELSATYRFEP